MALATQGSLGALRLKIGLTSQRIFTRNSFLTNIQTNVISHVDTLTEVMRGHAKSGEELALSELYFRFTLDRQASPLARSSRRQLRRHGIWLGARLYGVGHASPVRHSIRLRADAQYVFAYRLRSC